jgi:hypothetical protein|tara:strand:+ start:491 stop:778 length:288 start_codon:yes stop_codon:yes gene_type:complete
MITLTASNNASVQIENSDGGQYFLDVNGTIDAGGNVKAAVSFDGTNFSNLTTAVGVDLTITGNYNAAITLPSNCTVKFTATSIGSTGVKIYLVKV